MERRYGWNVDHGAVGSLVTVKKVSSAVACAVIVVILAIVGACYVVYQLVQLLMPVLIFVDFGGVTK